MRVRFRIVFSLIFFTFSAQIFATIFHRFWDENGIKSGPSCSLAVLSFLVFFATLSEDRFFMHWGRPLARFRHPLASKWLPFGARWLPFGSLLAPFGSLLAPFGSLWLTLPHFWHPFCRNSKIFHKFPYIRINLHDWLTIFKNFHVFRNPFRKKPKNAKGTPIEEIPSRANHPSKGPERNLCLWQLRLIDIY